MELTPDQWERVKVLFEAAADQTPAGRSSFLGSAREEPAVLQEVERLLASHNEAGDFMAASPTPSLFDPSVSPPPSLVMGTLLSDRFRITRFLARGGMGEVYEAEDIELRERVALKTIRPELVRDSGVLERFKREVHLAKKVTHPNVCRIFDLFRHQIRKPVDSESSSLVFVVMELLEGESLGQRLKRGQRLPAVDALPIAVQMSSGLGAAHDVGVLHRDFKPGNVVLVPTAKGTRAVVTDFGLALRAASDSGISAALTETGQSFGTPAYMSPEQVEGKPLTPASDVYSLGLVLYEMATGTRPFEDATPLSMAVKRLRENPVRPRQLVPDLDRHYEDVILRCLAREPERRFESGDEVAKALKNEIVLPSMKASVVPWTVLVAATAIILTAIGWFTPAIHDRLFPRPTVSEPTIRTRRSLAVLAFRNLSGRKEAEWVSTALPDMLTTELAAGEKLRTVPAESIARATNDLSLSGKDTLAGDTLKRLRQYLGSDYVVLGSYLEVGNASDGQVRVDLRLQDANTGEIIISVSEKGSERALDEVAGRAGADLREKLGLQAITPAEAALAKASLPSTPDAVRLYSEGLARLRVLDAQGARDLLLRATAADPNFGLAHSALADAWNMQGYDQKAQAESQRALDLSSSLSRESQLWVQGRYWALHHNWNKAVEIYRTLFGFFPDNLDYGLRLADAQAHARTVDEALATLAQLRRLPAPARDDPRIDLQQADVFDIKGAYKEQQAAATLAGNQAQTIGAQSLLVGALNRIARSLEKQGKLDDALATAQQASKIATEIGARTEVARALTLIGIVRFDQGSFSQASDAYQQSLAIYRETGNKRGAATTQNDLGNVLGEQGDLAGSIKMLQGSLATFREVGDKHSTAAVLGSIAARTLQQGNLPGAKQMLQEALAASREIGDQERAATAIYNLGETLRLQGDLKGAYQMYQQALSLSKSMNDQSGTAYAIAGFGDVLTAQGDLVGAKAKYDEAMAIRSQIGEKGTMAETQLAMATLFYEQGHPQEAESLLHQARDEFQKEGSTDDGILADLLLARIRLAQDRASDAEQELTAARDFVAKSQDFSVRLRSSIVNAEIIAASGKPEEGLRNLADTLRATKKHGYLGLKLEAQISIGQIQLATGGSSSGRANLAEARSSAARAGYGLLASKADRILNQSSKEGGRRTE